MEEILSLFANYQMKVIVILLVADVVLGIVSAIVKKDFSFSKVADFMKGPVLGYVLGFVVIELVAQAIPVLAPLAPGVFVLVGIALLASIIRNLGRFGVPLPKILKK